MPKVPWIARIVLVALLAAGGPRMIAADWEGLPVKEVRNQPEEPLEKPMEPAILDQILPLKTGEPYSSDKVRQSIERLYAMGRFTDIRADARREPDGVVLTFLTKSAYFIGTVEVRGVTAPPTEGQLRAATHLEAGHLYSPEGIPEVIESLRRVLEEDGYFQPEIVSSTSPHPDSQQIDITFNIRTGRRAGLGEINVTVGSEFAAAKLIAEAKWKRGKPLTSSLVQNGLEKIRKLYQKQNYLGASVAVTTRRFRPGDNLADLNLTVTAGKKIIVTVTGISISSGQTKKLIPIYSEGAVDDELLHEGERNLSDYFQNQGYFDAKVSYRQEERAPDSSTVEYQIDPGARQHLKEIQIQGNSYFNTETLREHMKVEPAGHTSSHGRFSTELLAQDLAAISALYQTNGFAQFSVTSSLSASGDPSDRQMTVSIQIREGPQTRVGKLTITGNLSFPQERLGSIINGQSGQPYSQSVVDSDRDNILTLYFDQGFPEAKFQSSEAPSQDPQRVNLEYMIEEGPREYVHHIYVDGLEHTRAGVVNRQLGFSDGQPLSHSGLIETQRHLYDLGIFNQVGVVIQNPTGQENQRNILIYLEEARRYTMKLGLGAEVGRFGGSSGDVTNVQGNTQFSPDISFELDRLSVGGRPHTASVSGRFSTLQKRAGLGYTAPHFLDREGLEGSARIFLDESRDVRTFTAKRVEGSLQFEDRKSKVTVYLYRYAFRRTTIDTSTLSISPALFPLLARPVLVGMINQTTIRDTRDNPADSHQGMFTSVDIGVAAKQFASDSSFVKLLLQNSSYYKLGKKWVLARSSQFGFQTPFARGRVVQAAVPAGESPQEIVTREIPIGEHFFSGGGNSHRGFAVNQAGPRDPVTGFPLGGNALLLNTVELRFPIWRDSVGGVLFHDMGNVFSKISDVTLRPHQKPLDDPGYMSHAIGCAQGSSTDCNLALEGSNYISHALGFGLRYRTPVGPIRLDMGYNLNPTRFLIQTAGSPVSQSLARWQFLFSIGQTF